MKRYLLAKSSFIALFLFGGVCPMCIPKLVLIASFFGITLVPVESVFLTILFHIAFLLVCILSFTNYKKHKVCIPFLLTVTGCLYLIAFSHLFPSVIVFPFWSLYAALGILVSAAIFDYYLCIKHNVLCTACIPTPSNATRSENQSSCCP